jgi:CRP-like cAMP-binding protein
MKSEIPISTFAFQIQLYRYNEDRIAIITEGQMSVASTEAALLIDDGNPRTREKHLQTSRYPADSTTGRICGPGFLVNPGVAFGFQRGTLAVVPYDRFIEAVVYYAVDFKELMDDHQPELMRNIMDTFINQLSLSRKALQRMVGLYKSLC